MVEAKSKLLVITQKVDRDDPILGFFHEWIAAFNPHFDLLNVLCLYRGSYDLDRNIKMWSLGKEAGASKFSYIYRFYKNIFYLRNSYDTVFVHMNVEYVLLAGLWWRMNGKKIILWYNHPEKSLKQWLAFRLAHVLCHTSPYAASAGTKKSKRMPAGIDCEVFKPLQLERRPHSILYIGRIAPLKKIHILVEALTLLHEREVDFFTGVYGDALPRNKDYFEMLKLKADALLKEHKLTFFESIKNRETPAIYNSYELFVNLTPCGNFDKTVLEALACGTEVIASSEAFFEVLDEPHRFLEDNPHSLAGKLEFLLNRRYQKDLQEKNRAYVRREHDLSFLAVSLRKLIHEIK